jgi:hypothetical protein
MKIGVMVFVTENEIGFPLSGETFWGAGVNTKPTFKARAKFFRLYLIGGQCHICDDRHQAHPRPIFGGDQQVIEPPLAQPCLYGCRHIGEVGGGQDGHLRFFVFRRNKSHGQEEDWESVVTPIFQILGYLVGYLV